MKALLIFLGSLFLFLGFPHLALAQQPTEQYSKGEVVKILEDGTKEFHGSKQRYQKIQIQLLDGTEKDKTITIEYGGIVELADYEMLSEGEIVVVQKSSVNNQTNYSIIDTYRLDVIIWIVIGFFLLVTLIAGRKGLGAILGMGVSLGVILFFIVPQILGGADPLFVSILGALMIMFTSIYLAHGFSKQTTIAVAATAVTLFITGLLSYTFVHIAGLTGTGAEDTSVLLFGTTINLQGLLLGGIIIGALGVLDDITTAQVAAVYEIHHTNPKITFAELLKKGHRIGREHIASLVNTLVLAYAGASLAIFILFVLNPANQPYWVILNSQEITEEIIRTIVGSIGLTLAVPLSTGFAAWYISRHR